MKSEWKLKNVAHSRKIPPEIPFSQFRNAVIFFPRLPPLFHKIHEIWNERNRKMAAIGASCRGKWTFLRESSEESKLMFI